MSDNIDMRILVLCIAFGLVGCSGDSDNNGEPVTGFDAMAKVLTLTNGSGTHYWDFSSVQLNTPFSAMITAADGDQCDCDITMTGTETEGAISVDCSPTPVGGMSAILCDWSDDFVEYNVSNSSVQFCFSSQTICRDWQF